MQGIKLAQSGTLESSDIMFSIIQAEKGSGRRIELESAVLFQYGNAIKAAIQNVLDHYDIQDVHICAVDRGALECTIRARLITALQRARLINGGH